MLNFEQIRQLIDIVCERNLGGLEVEETGFRLKIEGRIPAAVQAAPAVSEAVPTSAAAVASGAERRSEAEPGHERHQIKSPIVGTFYAAPSPDAEPFVAVGDKVTKGQVLCIVEAMKLMNEIESDVDGEVVEIFPKNAQPVEFGEPLFAVRVD